MINCFSSERQTVVVQPPSASTDAEEVLSPSCHGALSRQRFLTISMVRLLESTTRSQLSSWGKPQVCPSELFTTRVAFSREASATGRGDGPDPGQGQLYLTVPRSVSSRRPSHRGRPACHTSFALGFRPQLKLPCDSRPLQLGHNAYAHFAFRGSHDAPDLLRQHSSESPFRPSRSRGHSR